MMWRTNVLVNQTNYISSILSLLIFKSSKSVGHHHNHSKYRILIPLINARTQYSSSNEIPTEGLGTIKNNDKNNKGSNNNNNNRVHLQYVDEMDPKLIQEWTTIQEELKTKIIREDTEDWQKDFSLLQYVGGMDISYPKEAHDKSNCSAYACLVICKFPSMEVIHKVVQHWESDVPYVPGFLAFRELPPLLNLVEKLMKETPEFKPSVLFVDGNGMLHPQQCGVACHFGYHTGIPSIGVAKNLFHLDEVGMTKNDVQNMQETGDYREMVDSRSGNVLGMALKTTALSKNPLYVSIGHKISLETARKLVLACCKHRIPEPVRAADHISREFIRNLGLGNGEVNGVIK